jgi:hypothetical protein
LILRVFLRGMPRDISGQGLPGGEGGIRIYQSALSHAGFTEMLA